MCQFSEHSFGLLLQSGNNDNNDNKSALLEFIFGIMAHTMLHL